MDAKNYKEFREDFIERTFALSDKKRIEYTEGNQNADVLWNFKNIANKLGMTAIQILSVYLLKHISSLFQFFKKPNEKYSEPIEGRIMDIINYLLLLCALIKTTPQPNDNNTKRIGEESSRAVRNGADGTKL